MSDLVKFAFDDFRLLRLLLGLQLRKCAAYRGSFLLGLPVELVQEATGLIFLWVFLSHFPLVRGWGLGEMLVVYGLARTSIALAEMVFQQFANLGDVILSGGLDMCLVRPANRVLLFLSPRIRISGVGGLLVGIVTMVVGCEKLNVSVGSVGVIKLALSTVVGAFIYGGILFLSVLPCFWFDDRRGLVSPIMRLSDFALYPVPIFGRFILILLTFVAPFAFLGYYPALSAIRPAEALPLDPLPQIAVVAALWILSVILWRKGLRRYQSAGH